MTTKITTTKIMTTRRRLLGNAAMSLAALPLLSSTSASAGLFSRKKSTDWLAGGTQAMRAPFPPANVPFEEAGCKLTAKTGMGPCYFDNVTVGDDISEGELGIPMALAIKLTDANCEPIKEGALVEVWWCNSKGVYSADSYDSTNGTNLEEFRGDVVDDGGVVSNYYETTCAVLAGEAYKTSGALEKKWFRGKKLSDADGCVYFKGCFPGWYTRRSVHIHFRVTRLTGETYVTQLTYDEKLANDIFVNHPDYRGEVQDTPLAVDPIYTQIPDADYFFEVERQKDGSMLAYKTISIG